MIDIARDVTRTALIVGAEVLVFSPIPGLTGIAKVLLGIWDALLLVSVSASLVICIIIHSSCLRIVLDEQASVPPPH